MPVSKKTKGAKKVVAKKTKGGAKKQKGGGLLNMRVYVLKYYTGNFSGNYVAGVYTTLKSAKSAEKRFLTQHFEEEKYSKWMELDDLKIEPIKLNRDAF